MRDSEDIQDFTEEEKYKDEYNLNPCKFKRLIKIKTILEVIKCFLLKLPTHSWTG